MALGVGVAVAAAPTVAWADTEPAGPADATASSPAEGSAPRAQAQVSSEGSPSDAADVGGGGAADVGGGGAADDGGGGDEGKRAADGGMQVEASGGAITSTTPGSAGAEESDEETENAVAADDAEDAEDTIDPEDPEESKADAEDRDEATARTADASSSKVDRDSGARSSSPAAAPNRPLSAASAPVQTAAAPRSAAPVVQTADPAPGARVSTQQLSRSPDAVTLTSVVTPIPPPEPAATTWVSNVLSWVGFSPVAGGDVPAPPGESPLLLGLMAAWRRLSKDAAAGDVTNLRQVAETDNSLMLASAANTAPSVAPVVAAPNQATGAVAVSLNAVDPDGNPVSYTVTGQPVDGTLTTTGAGTYTYTPSAAARLRAGTTTAPDFDSFTVAVSDGQTTTPVTVKVPVLPAAWANQPSASNVTGASPYGVALVGNTAYVTNQGTNTVTVIDTLTGQTVGSPIVVGSAPAGVVASLDGAYVYVANKNSGTVSVIRTSDNKVVDINPATTAIDSIKVGSQPEMIAVNTSDITTATGVIKAGTRLYVTNYGSSTVSVIDVSNPVAPRLVDTNPATTTLDAIKVGSNPRGIAFAQTANGPRIYVVNRTSGTVSVIDAVTNKVVDANPATTTVDAISVGSAPQQIVVAPDGKTAYVTNYNSHTVSIINTATNKLVDAKPGTTAVDAISVGSYPIGVAVSPDGSLLYVATGSDRVSVIDTKTRAVVATLQIDTAVENNFHTLAVRADGSLMVTDLADRALRRVSYVRGNTAPVPLAGPTVGNPAPTNGAVTGSVNVKDWDGDSLTYTVVGHSAAGSVTVNSAGQYTFTPSEAARASAAQTQNADYTSFTIRATDPYAVSIDVTVSNVPIAPAPVSTVPDSTITPVDVGDLPAGSVVSGNTLYVANSGSNTVSVIDRTTNTVTHTISVGAGATNLVANPNGRYVYVGHSGFGGSDPAGNVVSVIDTSTKTVTAIITIPDGDAYNGGFDLAVSPDGRRLYVANQYDSLISVVDTNTNQVVSTTNVGYWHGDMEITPDGTRIYRNEPYGNLQVIDITGTPRVVGTVEILSESGSFEAHTLTISPDGKRVYVLTNDFIAGVSGAVSVVDIDPNSAAYNTEIGFVYVQATSDIAIDAERGRIYVTPAYGDFLVIDAETLAVAETSLPHGYLTVAPDGTLYITDTAGGTVHVVEFADAGGRTNTIDTGGLPTDIAVNGDYLYVANTSNHTVAVINKHTGAVLTTIPISVYPTSVVVSEQGDRVYVADFGYYGEYTGVGMIDADPASPTFNTVRFVPVTVEANPCGGGECAIQYGVTDVLVSPDGTRAYALASDGYVSVIDTGAATVLSRTALGPYGEAVLSEDGSKLYLWPHHESGSEAAMTQVVIVDTATMTKVGAVTIEPRYMTTDVAAVVSPDGSRAYAVVRDRYTHEFELSVIDIDVGSATYHREVGVVGVQSSEAGVWAIDVALNADGSRAYVLNHNGEVVVINTASLAVVDRIMVFAEGEYASDAAIAVDADGTVYVTNTQRGAVYAVATGRSAPQTRQM